MKAIAALTLFFLYTSAEVILKNGRSYAPEEEVVTEKRFMFINDGEGIPHLVDLKQGNKASVEIYPGDVRLYLYTRDSLDGEELSVESLDDLLNSPYYNSSLKNLFTVHGWRSSHRSDVNTDTRSAIFDIENVNAFAVDWSIPSDQFYTLVVWSIPLVGEIVGNYINDMISQYNIDASDFIFVGHSLGAHVAGCMGSTINGDVAWIAGLDPAWPMYSLADIDNRLDDTDASAVLIAHTNADFQGFRSSIGTVDYFFNGGSKQPGCGPDISNSCAHGRAVDYYVESLISSRFRALQCSSYEEYQSGACNGNIEEYFGGYPLDVSITGDFYLDTAASSPFALG